MPLGLSMSSPEGLVDVFRHTDVVQIERDHGAVQNAQHHALAELGRQRGYAEVDLASAHRHLDTPVLGQPALGDVQARDHLDARGHRQGQMLGRRGHFIEARRPRGSGF
jgi:hypothetical protein